MNSINLIRNQQNGFVNNKQNYPNKQKSATSFKGVTAVADYLATNPVWGATATDVTSMGLPRTAIDTVNRGFNGGFETGFREFTSTGNDAAVGAYGLLAGTAIAFMLKPFGLKDPQRIFASNESLDLHNAKWEANGGNINKFVDDYVESLSGFNPTDKGADNQGYVKIKDAHKDIIKEDLKTLADTSLSKKDRKVVEKRLKARLLEATGADNQLKLKHGNKVIEADSATVLDDFFRLTKAFREKASSVSSEKLVSRIKSFGKYRAVLGLGLAMAISCATQPINVYLTKKRTGSDGFAGMPDRKKDNTNTFKMMKLGAAASMAALALATMKAKPSQVLSKIMYKAPIPSIDQIKALFGATIISRMLVARDRDELAESSRKDMLGFVNWLLIGNLINKGVLMGAQDKKNPVIRVSETDKNKKGIKGAFARFFNSTTASRREVLVEGLQKEGKSAIKANGTAKTLTEMLKELPKNSVARKNIKLLNIAQGINYAYTIAVLGYGIPKLNIAMTNRAQKKRNEQKQQLIKDTVMTIKNQEYIIKHSNSKTFNSFKRAKEN